MFSKRYGIERDRFVAIVNGVNVERFATVEPHTRDEMRGKTGRQKNGLCVMYVGGYVAFEGLELVPDGARLVADWELIYRERQRNIHIYRNHDYPPKRGD